MKVRPELSLFWLKPPCFSYANGAVLMLISVHLHKRSIELQPHFHSKARKPSTTVKWSIALVGFSTVTWKPPSIMKAKLRYNVYIAYLVTKACMVNCVSFAASETVDYCVRYSEMSPVFSPKSALLVGLGLLNGRNAPAVHIGTFVKFYWTSYRLWRERIYYNFVCLFSCFWSKRLIQNLLRKQALQRLFFFSKQTNKQKRSKNSPGWLEIIDDIVGSAFVHAKMQWTLYAPKYAPVTFDAKGLKWMLLKSCDSKPNFSSPRSSVFVRGDQKWLCDSFYTLINKCLFLLLRITEV